MNEFYARFVKFEDILEVLFEGSTDSIILREMWYRHVTVDRYIRSSFLNKVIFFTISSKFYSLSRFDRPDFFCITVSTSDTTFILYSPIILVFRNTFDTIRTHTKYVSRIRRN